MAELRFVKSIAGNPWPYNKEKSECPHLHGHFFEKIAIFAVYLHFHARACDIINIVAQNETGAVEAWP